MEDEKFNPMPLNVFFNAILRMFRKGRTYQEELVKSEIAAKFTICAIERVLLGRIGTSWQVLRSDIEDIDGR